MPCPHGSHDREHNMTQSTDLRSQSPDPNGMKIFGIDLARVINDDMKSGLPMIIYARWVLVITGFGLIIWNPPDNLLEIQISILILIVLAVGNFFLQVEVNRERPIRTWIVYAASIVDIVAISGVLVLTNVFPSSTYVFYMPALLALSVTFSTFTTAKYTLTALATYLLSSIGPINDLVGSDPSAGTVAATNLIIHALVLVAVPFCGNVYWRLEKTRRAQEIEADLVEQQLTEDFETTSIGGDA